MTIALWNLAVYSAQLVTLVLAASLAQRALPVRVPGLLLRYWQACAGAALLLPLVQPWLPAAATTAVRSPREPAPAAAVATLTTAPSIDWTRAAAIVIAIGIVVRLGRLIAGAARLQRVVARATASGIVVPGAEVLLTNDIGSPATVGWRRAKILLPLRTLTLSAPVQEAIVTHELIHVERRDWLATIAEELACAVWWFNPAAGILASQLSLAREAVVDDLTLQRTRNRRAYAEALLAFADPQPQLVGATPFIRRRTLGQRIALIAQEVPMSHRRALFHLTAAGILVAATTSMAASEWPMTAAAVRQTVYKGGNGVSLPTVVHEVKPEYTKEALQQHVQGDVFLTIVVAETGDVGAAEVTKSLDQEYGLDQQALEAAKQWKFKPGMKDGKPVAVQVELQMTFRLK